MPYRGFHDAYEALPEVIRGQLTREQFAWLDDKQKAQLVEDMTTPEIFEDPA